MPRSHPIVFAGRRPSDGIHLDLLRPRPDECHSFGDASWNLGNGRRVLSPIPVVVSQGLPIDGGMSCCTQRLALAPSCAAHIGLWLGTMWMLLTLSAALLFRSNHHRIKLMLSGFVLSIDSLIRNNSTRYYFITRQCMLHHSPMHALTHTCMLSLTHAWVLKIHLLGSDLGGYLAQLYLQFRPSRVCSLILNNTFCDTQHFADAAPCVSMYVSLARSLALAHMSDACECL
jgi:hypothetical protein